MFAMSASCDEKANPMNPFETHSRSVMQYAALLLFTLVAGCGDRILGMGNFAGTAQATADTTRPTVTFTVPAAGAVNVATNARITATFSEDMLAATILAPGTFTVCANPCVTAVAGTVSYTAGARTATFAPTASLPVSTQFTATITTAATDLAGNALGGNQAAPPAASDYVWTFTTGVSADNTAPTVTLVFPADLATGVCPNAAISATFSEPMDAGTITTATITLQVTNPLGPVLPGVVSYDAAGNAATLKPASDLVATNYTATVTTGAQDLAGNPLAADKVWTFDVGPACGAQAQPVALGTAAPFGSMGGSAGMTNQGTLTVVNGDISTMAVSTAVTGFHDPGVGCTYTETASNVGTVNGKIYTAAPPPTVNCPTEGTAQTFEIARQARDDALAAYNYLAGLATTGVVAANLSGLTVSPGVYFSSTGFLIQDGLPGTAGDLTLDGLGDANALFVFQSASTLLVGGPGAAFPRSVKLINGAQAKNVFWQVGTFATINAAGGGTMKGTIISQDGGSVSTAGNVTIVTIDGRILSLGASVTVVDTVINVPAP